MYFLWMHNSILTGLPAGVPGLEGSAGCKWATSSHISQASTGNASMMLAPTWMPRQVGDTYRLSLSHWPQVLDLGKPRRQTSSMSKQTWISAEMALCSMLSHSFSSTELLLLSGSWRAKQDILSSLGAHQPDAKLSHAAAQQSANVWHAMTATECQCMACNDCNRVPMYGMQWQPVYLQSRNCVGTCATDS
jgi:hypothetical protein